MAKELVLQYPDENTPGILMFLRRVALFSQVMNDPSAFTVEEIDDSYEFLLSLVVEPKRRDHAKSRLMELSSKQLGALFEGISGTVAPDPKE